MSFAEPGREGTVSGQMHFADALGFSLMGGIGGATVAIADRTSLGLRAGDRHQLLARHRLRASLGLHRQQGCTPSGLTCHDRGPWGR